MSLTIIEEETKRSHYNGPNSYYLSSVIFKQTLILQGRHKRVNLYN